MTQELDSAVLLTDQAQPPLCGISSFFSLDGSDWDTIRHGGIAPRFESDFNGDSELRSEFIVGARMLGLIGRTKTLKPQQLRTVDVLNAGHRFTAVLEPRRSSKTTTLLAWALGRCAEREDYLIGYTVMTSAKKARDRYNKDIVPILERLYPDPNNRPFKIRKAAGQERIEFDNGSIFQILGPFGDDFRSDAYDVLILDEAGEATPEMGDDVLTAALPTQDTRPNPMIVIAGTAAEYRTGNLLWDALEDGRNARNQTGIIEYSAPDTLTAEDTETWEAIEPHVVAAHPGVGNLTPLTAVQANFSKMKRAQFMREYLGIFGDIGNSAGLIKPAQWAAAGLDEALPTPPDRFALAITCTPNQAAASIVAAWREDGMAYLLSLEHRDGTRWLNGRALELSRKYKTPIVHDSMGPVLVEVEELQRAKPRPALAPQTTKNVCTAAALLIREIEHGKVRHYGQDALTVPALIVRKRTVGTNSWAFGRANMDDDISAIEAASMALRAYDDMPARAKVAIVTA